MTDWAKQRTCRRIGTTIRLSGRIRYRKQRAGIRSKLGFEIRRFGENFLFDSSARGTLNFTPFYTAQASVSAAGVVNAVSGTGNAIADLLLGDVNTASVSRSFAGINASTVAGSSADFHESVRAG